MNKLLSFCFGLLLAVSAIAQEETPTANWPYLYPDFMEGELLRFNKNPNKARFNIHLNHSELHYLDKDGIIKESDVLGSTGLVIGNDAFRNVGGKMMKILAEAKGGFVVRETRANYAAIVRNDGAYGTTSLNSTTTKTFLYNENVINGYDGKLLTDVYADLHAMKEDSESLPVLINVYLVIGLDVIPANKKSVTSMCGVDKKAFKAFLKENRIDWDDPQDLVKVIDYVTAE